MNSPRVRAPKLPSDPDLWLNTGGRPVSIPNGSVTLLDFWTYCCINCLHILPDLKYLETKYAGKPFVVIGVHAGKFHNEKDAHNLRNAVLRHDIRHPVLRDDAFQVWRSFGVRAWPTLVLISPDGYVLGSVSGEGHREQLDHVIGKLLEIYETQGGAGAPLEGFALEMEQEADRPLYYPGKLFADAAARRLYISDTRHNRIVSCDLDGANFRTIGSGEEGDEDGDFRSASFYQPQGLTVWNGALYVCDTENHQIRRVGFADRTVQTVAGTGEQGSAAISGGDGLATPLSSPWDICAAQNALYIAMAGSHQIWRFDPEQNEITPFAGTGREARIDGLAGAAAFAQPSGIATDGSALYIADSEISSVRQIQREDEALTTTLAGGDLFDFGDADGAGDAVRLQHPLGVCWHEGLVYIADTFNHKVKVLDPKTRAVTTLIGNGEAGKALGTPQETRLYEPGGLAWADGRLYIADTNNHRVCIYDPQENRVWELEIPGLCGTALCFPVRQ